MNKLMIYLLISLIGICAFTTCNYDKQEKIKSTYKQQLDSLKSIDKKYQQELQEYQQTNESLQQAYEASTSSLKIERVKLAATKLKLKAALETSWTGITPEEKSGKCDTLREQIIHYQAAQNIIDSLTENSVSILVRQNTEKDEQLTKCSEAYNDLKQTFESSIGDNRLLNERYNKLVKRHNRQAFKSRILSVTAVILSTATATLIIIR